MAMLYTKQFEDHKCLTHPPQAMYVCPLGSLTKNSWHWEQAKQSTCLTESPGRVRNLKRNQKAPSRFQKHIIFIIMHHFVRWLSVVQALPHLTKRLIMEIHEAMDPSVTDLVGFGSKAWHYHPGQDLRGSGAWEEERFKPYLKICQETPTSRNGPRSMSESRHHPTSASAGCCWNMPEM